MSAKNSTRESWVKFITNVINARRYKYYDVFTGTRRSKNGDSMSALDYHNLIMKIELFYKVPRVNHK